MKRVVRINSILRRLPGRNLSLAEVEKEMNALWDYYEDMKLM